MNVRTFYAKSMQEAIRAIKQELGPEAVILSSRRVRKWGNGFGILGSSALEVTAAIDEGMPLQPHAADVTTTREAPPAPIQPSGESSFQGTLRAALHPAAQSALRYQMDEHQFRAVTPAEIPPRPRQETPTNPSPTVLPSSVKQGQSSSDLSSSLQGLYENLIAQGLRDRTAYTCLRELQDNLRDPDRTVPHFMLQLLRSLLTDRVRPAGPLLATEEEQKIAVFVGPSGVGKTTTIAKLAAFYRLEEKRSVALVTIDNYRPAAVEQLRLYANVLGVDLATASTGEEARDCIAQFNQAELILVDTPGFNPMQRLPVDYWMPLSTLPQPLEVHLVLSATTRIQDIDMCIARCSDVPSLRLLFTKLDETSAYGTVFEAGHQTAIPLSYWGTGPRVPEDLAPASPDRLSDILLGGTVRARQVSDTAFLKFHSEHGSSYPRTSVSLHLPPSHPPSAMEHRHE